MKTKPKTLRKKKARKQPKTKPQTATQALALLNKATSRKPNTKRRLVRYRANPTHVRPCMRVRVARWQAAFIDALARCPSVTAACRVAGISRVQAYAHKERDEKFAAAWDDAIEQSIEGLEAHAFAKAIRGDATLMQFFLKAHKPSIYSDKMRHEVGLLGGIVLLPPKEQGPE
jgi:hypothetical protein